jgi:peptide deformylase
MLIAQHLLLLYYCHSFHIVVTHGFLAQRSTLDDVAQDIGSVESWSHKQAATEQLMDRGQFLGGGMTGLIQAISLPTLLLPNNSLSRSGSVKAATISTEYTVRHPFQYSSAWTGTRLRSLNVSTAVAQAIAIEASADSKITKYRWPMGRWPDPILRRSADPVDSRLIGTEVLRQACVILRNTAVAEGAIGLAAQQCGVNARIIYLKIPPYRENSYIVLINPHILRRSSESKMRAWKENCLVFPPSFQATVLRDAWVDVVYQDWKGKLQNFNDVPSWHVRRMYGELSRAVQHEMDHDRGILVTDHVSLDELDNNLMRFIECPGHERRMSMAYDRHLYEY